MNEHWKSRIAAGFAGFGVAGLSLGLAGLTPASAHVVPLDNPCIGTLCGGAVNDDHITYGGSWGQCNKFGVHRTYDYSSAGLLLRRGMAYTPGVAAGTCGTYGVRLVTIRTSTHEAAGNHMYEDWGWTYGTSYPRKESPYTFVVSRDLAYSEHYFWDSNTAGSATIMLWKG